jgi:hypothetical protein
MTQIYYPCQTPRVLSVRDLRCTGNPESILLYGFYGLVVFHSITQSYVEHLKLVTTWLHARKAEEWSLSSRSPSSIQEARKTMATMYWESLYI